MDRRRRPDGLCATRYDRCANLVRAAALGLLLRLATLHEGALAAAAAVVPSPTAGLGAAATAVAPSPTAGLAPETTGAGVPQETTTRRRGAKGTTPIRFRQINNKQQEATTTTGATTTPVGPLLPSTINRTTKGEGRQQQQQKKTSGRTVLKGGKDRGQLPWRGIAKSDKTKYYND